MLECTELEDVGVTSRCFARNNYQGCNPAERWWLEYEMRRYCAMMGPACSQDESNSAISALFSQSGGETRGSGSGGTRSGGSAASSIQAAPPPQGQSSGGFIRVQHSPEGAQLASQDMDRLVYAAWRAGHINGVRFDFFLEEPKEQGWALYAPGEFVYLGVRGERTGETNTASFAPPRPGYIAIIHTHPTWAFGYPGGATTDTTFPYTESIVRAFSWSGLVLLWGTMSGCAEDDEHFQEVQDTSPRDRGFGAHIALFMRIANGKQREGVRRNPIAGWEGGAHRVVASQG